VGAGGTNGQIQYNNSGLFGGFTMSGDCTTDTTTGAITCTKTNGNTYGPFATVANCIGYIDGLLPGKVGGGELELNYGSWCNNTGDKVWSNGLLNNTLKADLTVSTVTCNNAPSPSFGGMMSGALDPTSDSTDGVEVYLYMGHCISNNAPIFFADSSDIQGPFSLTFASTAGAPGILVFSAPHGLRPRQSIYLLSNGGTLPSPLAQGVHYYVCTVPDVDQITLATSVANANAGSCLTTTTDAIGSVEGQWGTQADIDFQLGANVVKFDRGLPWGSFIWSWTRWGSSGIPGGTNGIPDFQGTPNGVDVTLTDACACTPFQVLANGTSTSVAQVDATPVLSNINRMALLMTVCTSAVTLGQCFISVNGVGGTGIPAGNTAVATISDTAMWWLQMDSNIKFGYKVTGGAALSIYVIGWRSTDPR
jgi:hypothetical protein